MHTSHSHTTHGCAPAEGGGRLLAALGGGGRLLAGAAAAVTPLMLTAGVRSGTEQWVLPLSSTKGL